ncbi:MAG: WbqC family protein [Caldilineales bacterium]
MRLGIMQPYFFPYLGYFDLINSVDHFVIYDSVQYIKHGWINRNRVLKPGEGWQYITAPVDRRSFHDSYRTPIKDVEVVQGDAWKERIQGQLDHYRKRAPRFQETISLVSTCLDSDERSISRLNASILREICDALRVAFSYSFASEMPMAHDAELDAQDRVLAICEWLGAGTYINLPGGRDLYDEQHFRQRGVQIEFRELPPLVYSCLAYQFVPNLSIIDVLMWNEPVRIRQHLELNR